ncbi:recombination mediator RecR [Rothia kristinae]|uniref:recombination mediator RecR n=1 Tax=Rothia kristinae TaxID=37923 RepID=UPI00119E1718|nr:recombination mediator RecR [Rothia kristinae]
MYQGAVQDLIDELGRLPGVGPKSAQRIAFHILNSPAEEMEKLSAAITTVKRKVSFCEICGNISETPKCSICRDARRDTSLICVVEEPKDVSAIERTGSFDGRYHVLGGSINPMQGIGPEQLRIRQLVTRLADEEVQEIILAMDPNLEGEATATYLSRLLNPIGVTVSRLASGLPVGGDLEYADEITLGRALEGRRVLTAGMRRAAEEARLADEEDAENFAANPEALDHHPDDDGSESSGSSEEPGGDEPERGGAGSEASPEVPTRRYPTPRRGERFANPWAD